MPAWSHVIASPASVLLAGLFAGHILADFLAQTHAMAERKRERAQAMLLHGLVTLGVQLACVLPFWNAAVIAGVFAIALFHLAVDMLRARIDPRWKQPLPSLLLDQSLHAAGILACWAWLTSQGAPARGWIEFDAAWMPFAARLLLLAAGFTFNAKGGTSIVRALLQRFPQAVPAKRTGAGSTPAVPEDAYATGRVIGTLERFIVLGLVLLDQWAAIGLVLAAKSIARFKELDSQPFADYYLIGTLTSMLVALASGFLLRAVLLQ
jgi:hypothetical protein